MKFVYLVIRQGGIPYVTLVKECPEGVVVNESTKTWTHQGGQEHKIGEYAIRATQKTDHPVGVFDPTIFDHLQALLRAGVQFENNNDLSGDWSD